jgi:prepilin-type processing-associated H-X9-DG protein
LGNVTTLTAVTGMDEKGCVNKTLLSIDGQPTGILGLADVKPLAAGDLAPIPHDATFALAFRLKPEQVLDVILDIAGKIDPRTREHILHGDDVMKSELGLSLRENVLKPLGDTWRLYDSPSEGGALTGLTLVASLADAKQAAATNDTLVKLFQSKLEAQRKVRQANANAHRWRPKLSERLDTFKFAGQQVSVYNGGIHFPIFEPSWCITDKELIISLHPQAIKAYLSRPADFQSLAQVPEVARLFQGDAGPLKFFYGDSQRVFDVLYPLVLSNVRQPIADLQRSGIELNPGLLPSARAIRPHLKPTLIATRRTKAGIEVVEQRSVPGPSIGTAVPIGIGAMIPAVQSSRAAARRVQSMNNLKQIGLAMHNHAAAHRTFPPAYKADKNGKPLLSWRVLILPFTEEQPLYREFHLDEPWDSPHNKKLIARMPAVYQSPTSSVGGLGKTNYLTVRGKDTIFSGEEGIGFASITDGTSNTIMTVEVPDSKAVIWTKPDDFEYDEENPMKGLIGLQPGGFNVGFADGSVHFIRSSIKPETLKAMFTRNGGEVIDRNEIYR